MEEYAKRLSIVVPVYNVEKYLERCINSLLNQDLKKSEYEIIMVNDGSTDGSYEIAKRLTDEHKNITLLTQENQGLSGARNTGIKNANGKYIFFVDSDDFIEKNILKAILNISENEELDICFFKPMVYYNKNKILKFDCPTYADGKVYDGKFLLTKDVAMTSVWHAFYNRFFLEKTAIQFCVGLLHEDIDFHLRLFPFAERVKLNDINGYYYCQNGESILRTKDKSKISRLFKSEFEIVKNVINHSNNNNFQNNIKKYYSKQCASMIFSALTRLIKNDYLDIKEKKEILAFAHENGVYPLWRLTKSWKSSLLFPLLNFPIIIHTLFHLSFLQKPEIKSW